MEWVAIQGRWPTLFSRGVGNKNSSRRILFFSVGPAYPPLTCDFSRPENGANSRTEMVSCFLIGIHGDVVIWGRTSILRLRNRHLNWVKKKMLGMMCEHVWMTDIHTHGLSLPSALLRKPSLEITSRAKEKLHSILMVPLVALWPQATPFPFLGLSFPTCKMES